MGCILAVVYDQLSIESVKGYRCKKGLAYAESEIVDPKRTLTTTVKVKGGTLPLVPVHSREPIPRKLIFELLGLLEQVELQAPVKMGQPVLENVFERGIDVIASRDLPLRSQDIDKDNPLGIS
jgi:CxxC motif-containing protein